MQGMTTNLLASRLQEMEADSLIQKRHERSLGSSHVYELTELGRKLEDVVLALGRFGYHYMQSGPKPDDQMDIGRSLLSLKLRNTGTQNGAITFDFLNQDNDDHTIYQVRFSPEYVDICHSITFPSQATIAMPFESFRALAFQGASSKALVNSKQMRNDGDP
jgi:hypothetical protein